MNIYLDEEMMGDLASGSNGMLEVLLFELMAKYKWENKPSYYQHREGAQEEGYRGEE